MRIIGGSLKNQRIDPPANLPVRPTTDLAKEALFNILHNQYDIEELSVLDLFSGTGNIAFEFASRNAQLVQAVDKTFGCVNWIKKAAQQYKLDQVSVYKADVFKYLEMETTQYDIIFADPPYDLKNIAMIAKLVFERNLLKPGGTLIIEHQSMLQLANHPNFKEQRKYGYSSFSFFS